MGIEAPMLRKILSGSNYSRRSFCFRQLHLSFKNPVVGFIAARMIKRQGMYYSCFLPIPPLFFCVLWFLNHLDKSAIELARINEGEK